MKTYQPYLFALWVTLCLAACNNEDNVLSTPDEYSATIWAGIDKNADARIALGQSEAGATKLYWTADDAFALVNGNDRYTFTRSDNGTAPVADASFTYSGSKQLPAINTSGLKFVYPAEPVSGYATQTGKEEDLSQCLGMEAAMPNGATSYNDLSLRFTHTTAVVKMALTHNRFKGQDVSIKFFAQGLLPDGNLITTGKLKGDSNGAVTAYIVIPVTGKALTNCRIYATAGGKTYETSLGNKTVASGKLYEITKSDLVESTQLIACKLPIGSKFNSILKNIIGNSTKIKFIANSNEGTAISDIPGAAYRINGEWLEIHTPLLEFLFNEDSSLMFDGASLTQLQKVVTIDFNNCINTSLVTNMSRMFWSCHSLTSLDIRNFNVSNVTNFSNMFLNLGSKSRGKTPIYVTSALKNILETKSTGLGAEDAEYKLVD
jgi:surface protein